MEHVYVIMRLPTMEDLHTLTRATERCYFSGYAVQNMVDKKQCDLMINERQ